MRDTIHGAGIAVAGFIGAIGIYLVASQIEIAITEIVTALFR